MVQTKKEIGPLCMLIGAWLLIVVIISQALDYYNEKSLLSTLGQVQIENKKELPIAEAPVVQVEGKIEEKRVKGEEEHLLGKVKIAKIDLEVPLVEGTEKKDLRSAVGHMKGTGLPGSGNCVIAGHRNYSFGRFFNRLDEVEVGDIVDIETVEGNSYTYQVNQITIVEPEDVSVLEPTSHEKLTLITCTPIYIASHRLIVEAKLIANP